jgi:hypothetical protein
VAHYFFHFRDGRSLLRDGEGRDLASVARMRMAALAEARSMIADDVLHGNVHLDPRIEVEDSSGAAVYSLAFADAVTVTGGGG